MQYIKHWFPCVLWAAFIFYMSSRQGLDLPPFPFADKIIHTFVYAVLGFFTARVLIKNYKLEKYQIIIISVLVAGFYGFTDEIHQLYVPTRSAEALDLLMDFIGGFLGSVIYGYIPCNFKKG